MVVKENPDGKKTKQTNLNPGPLHNDEFQPLSKCGVFNSRGFRFIIFNVNNSLPKITLTYNIAKLSNAAVIALESQNRTIPFSRLTYTMIIIIHFPVIGTDIRGR